VQGVGSEAKAAGLDDGKKCFELPWIQSHAEVLWLPRQLAIPGKRMSA
jgi:hypothetical protein